MTRRYLPVAGFKPAETTNSHVPGDRSRIVPIGTVGTVLSEPSVGTVLSEPSEPSLRGRFAARSGGQLDPHAQKLPLSWEDAVRPLGFEPRTCGLRVRCSAVELEARFAGGVYGAWSAVPNRPHWGERGDLNPRPSGPQPDALTRLSYAHHEGCHSGTGTAQFLQFAPVRVPTVGARSVDDGHQWQRIPSCSSLVPT